MTVPPSRPVCTQCGCAPVLFEIPGGHQLCLSCTERYEAVQLSESTRKAQDFARSAALHNRAAAQLENLMPIPGHRVPRMEIPQTGIRAQSVNLHNVSVNNSVVGAINTGTIERLIVSLREIKQGGGADGAAKIEELVQAIQEAREFSKNQRAEVMELLSVVAEQTARPENDRQPSLLKMVTGKLGEILSASAKCASIWSAVCATLKLVSCG